MAFSIKNIQVRKAQAEVITTVLMILIGIVAVGILSAFIINMVRTNLKGTECFESMGQLEVNLENGWSYFVIQGGVGVVYVNIERGSKDFNLTGINIVYGNGVETKKVLLENGKVTAGVQYVTGINSAQDTIVLPQPGESKTYNITSALSGDITKVGVAPTVNYVECSVADEKEISKKI